MEEGIIVSENELKDLLIGLKGLTDWQKLWAKIGVKLNTFMDNGNITLFGGFEENFYFCYVEAYPEKITKKAVKNLLDKYQMISDARYLVLMIQKYGKNGSSTLIGVDLANKINPKITSFLIDREGTYNIEQKEIRYKNRTLIEQFIELSKNLLGGGRNLKIRYLKSFFEKQKLTEKFYEVYKTELFDEIKKDLVKQFGKENTEDINNFILVNLNRLLFIHFLDKKGTVFKNYDKKYGSYISYLFHVIHKEPGKQFYNEILKPLFFETFNKPYSQRKYNNPILESEFGNLPYLNGGLFKQSKYENDKFYIDNVFIKSFILNIIDAYNFTIKEDTPFDVKVSVDPELLGYIFENLIQEYDKSQSSEEKKEIKEKKGKKKSERNDSGVFYTPKIEVDFMCRQVLIEYLSKQEELKKLKPQLYELFYSEKGGIEEQKSGSFSDREIGIIFYYLEKLKIVDPACGSGAFLVGMMQVIMDIEDSLLENNISKIKESNNEKLKEYLRTKLNSFQRKKQLIKNSLYGVDIKSWAVEIAKLRLWLSMVIDVKEEAFKSENAKNEPLLPSFGFHIVQGDSLVNRLGDDLIPVDVAVNSKELSEKVDELILLKNKFYENEIIEKDSHLLDGDVSNEDYIKHKEVLFYETLLSNKIRGFKGEITKLENKKKANNNTTLFGTAQFGGTFKNEEINVKKINKEIEEHLLEIDALDKQLMEIKNTGTVPFSRGIDFADVFVEKGGFDIVVGNPPYVRQEDIADATGKISDKSVYKKILGEVANKDRFKDIKKYQRIELKIGGQSDLYIYFYFRGLKLLNSGGVFTFITSNSWLDVDFGATLQEFLIKYCPNVKIFNNQIQRSFASAAINTIICFFDKPVINAKDTISGNAQFINFKKPYEESIRSETMAEMDHQVVNNEFESREIRTGDMLFIKRDCDELRVIDISMESLWNDGSEIIGEESLNIRKYIGNKRGGKFFKAPEVFFKILSSGKIEKISKSFSISAGCYTGINDFFYVNKDTVKQYKIEEEYLVPVIRNSKEVDKLNVSKDLKYFVLGVPPIDKSELKKGVVSYINRGETQVTRERQKTKAGIPRNKVESVKTRKFWYSIPEQNLQGTQIFMQYVGSERFYCPFSEYLVTSDRSFHRLFPKNDIDKQVMTAILNSSLQMFFVMLFGRDNLGLGAMKFEVTDAKRTFMFDGTSLSDEDKIKIKGYLKNIGDRHPLSIFTEIGLDPKKDIYSQIPNPLPDRKGLDDIIFSKFGLNQEEKNEIYRSLAEMVKNRIEKAKSV